MSNEPRTMNNALIKAGEFARLSNTSKRTLLFYHEKGILKPKLVDEKGYRYYEPEQILDFQVILLLRKLGFSVGYIEKAINKGVSLEELFKNKREGVIQEINTLKFKLLKIDEYLKSQYQSGLLVDPVVKVVNEFEGFYLVKKGPYVDVSEYVKDVMDCFSYIPDETVFFVYYQGHEYRPINSKMRVGLIKNDGLVLNDEGKEMLHESVFEQYKALTYTHRGSYSLLSYLWKQMEAYAKKYHFKVNKNLSCIEWYIHNPEKLTPDDHITEMQLPVV